ncbi:hypothetical protein [Micromonospora sp. WMMD1082]|uniref:effector-associated constant component EACC1 n=1 Tax=Micromonospora sp. WMMD1082 TaxID=3016104 RepID=UPI002416E4D4|nr:hypothetical protein [Micromonospora sp. WMMD1082]MDG4797897.1 hypothetical protein [Micromonospora sp. WMMD1082]
MPSGKRITLSADDSPGEIDSLYTWLHGTSGLTVDFTAGAPPAGRQGAADLVTVVFGAGGAGLVVVQVLRSWLESRRSIVKLHVKIGDREFDLDATNADEILPLLEEFLRDS